MIRRGDLARCRVSGVLACTEDGRSFLTCVPLLVSGASATAAPQIYSECWTFLSFFPHQNGL